MTPREDFQQRLERLGAQADTVVGGPSSGSNPPVGRRDGSWVSGAVLGALCSAAVVFLFNNIQRISDAAPQSVQDSEMPGLLGAPIAILAVAWFTVIPLWFVWSVVASATTGRSSPRAFVVGAFLGLAAYFAAIRLL